MVDIGFRFIRVAPGRWRRTALQSGCLLGVIGYGALVVWLLEEIMRIVGITDYLTSSGFRRLLELLGKLLRVHPSP
jgi:hypothetical protein